MIKKILFVLIVAFFAGCGESGAKKDDYFQIDSIAGAQNSLIKVFSYECIFCYKYDETLDEILSQTNLDYKPYSLGMEQHGAVASQLFAALITKDKSQNITLTSPDSTFKKAKSAYYRAFHNEKRIWKNNDEFLDFGLNAAGVDRSEFEHLLENSQTKELLNAWQDAPKIAQVHGGVPTFVVNGKYVINLRQIKSLEDLIALINELKNK